MEVCITVLRYFRATLYTSITAPLVGQLSVAVLLDHQRAYQHLKLVPAPYNSSLLVESQ
jgi:hypothetical protein